MAVAGGVLFEEVPRPGMSDRAVVGETIVAVRDALAALESSLSDGELVGASAQDSFETLVGLCDQLSMAAGRCGAAAHDSGAHSGWGFTSAGRLAAHRAKTSAGVTRRMVRRARGEGIFPLFDHARRDRLISGEHIDPLFAIWDRHPSCRELLEHDEAVLLEAAVSLSPEEFARVCRHWLALADPPTLDADYRKRYEGRGLLIARRLDGSLVFHGECDPVTGEVITNALDHHTKRLADADHAARAAAREAEDAAAAAGDGAADGDDLEPGYPASPADIGVGKPDRTARQRRVDALASALLDSMATPPGAQRPEPLVSLVLGDQTLEDHLRTRLADPDRRPTDSSGSASPGDLGVLHRLSPGASPRTESGHPVPASVALAAMIHGRIARIVVDAEGTIIDAGRSRRLHTPTQRRLLALQFGACVFPGCDHPARDCEIDHLVEWASGGETSLDNGAPLCRHHHGLKTKGFFWIERDGEGRLRFVRFDGTLLS